MVYLLHVNNNNFSITSSNEGIITTNEVSYTSTSNFLNQPIVSATTHITGSSLNPKLITDIRVTPSSQLAIWHIYGTITKDINTSVTYYQITSTGPNNDPSVIISANPYSNIDIVDTCLIESSITVNNYYLIFYCLPVKNDQTSDSSSVYNYDFTVDYYQM